MATEAQIRANRENAKKAGRKKGVATVRAEEARRVLSEMVFKEITPIGNRLLKEAKKGNIQAIKELFDRAFGKAPQALEVKGQFMISNLLDDVENNER